MLLSTPNSASNERSDTLTAADRLGETLAETEEELDSDAFAALLDRCNETIDVELDIDYGAVCDAGSDCC